MKLSMLVIVTVLDPADMRTQQHRLLSVVESTDMEIIGVNNSDTENLSP